MCNFNQRKTYHNLITFLTLQFLHHLQRLHYGAAQGQASRHAPCPQELIEDIGECKCTVVQFEPSRHAPSASRELSRICRQHRIFGCPKYIINEVNIKYMVQTKNIIDLLRRVPQNLLPQLYFEKTFVIILLTLIFRAINTK